MTRKAYALMPNGEVVEFKGLRDRDAELAGHGWQVELQPVNASDPRIRRYVRKEARDLARYLANTAEYRAQFDAK